LFAAPDLDDKEPRVVEDVEDVRQVLRLQLREPRRWKGRSLRPQAAMRLSFASNIQGSSIEGYDASLDTRRRCQTGLVYVDGLMASLIAAPPLRAGS